MGNLEDEGIVLGNEVTLPSSPNRALLISELDGAHTAVCVAPHPGTMAPTIVKVPTACLQAKEVKYDDYHHRRLVPKAGDKARLRNSGDDPRGLMTVASVDGENATCVWLDADLKIVVVTVNKRCLQLLPR